MDHPALTVSNFMGNSIGTKGLNVNRVSSSIIEDNYKCIQSDFSITTRIAPDKAAYCVFTQFRGPENAIKLISVRTKTQ